MPAINQAAIKSPCLGGELARLKLKHSRIDAIIKKIVRYFSAGAFDRKLHEKLLIELFCAFVRSSYEIVLSGESRRHGQTIETIGKASQNVQKPFEKPANEAV